VSFTPELIFQIGMLVIALIMLLGGGMLVLRRSTGWNSLTLQALGLLLLVPTVLLLAANGSLSREVVATLLGGIAGYIFARGGDTPAQEPAPRVGRSEFSQG